MNNVYDPILLYISRLPNYPPFTAIYRSIVVILSSCSLF